MNPNNPAPVQPAPISTTVPYEENGSSLKKKILIAVIVLLVLGSITAAVFFFVIPRFFGGGAAKGELVYWGLWEDSKVMEPIIADFNREYPDIKIRYEKQDITKLNDYIARLTTRIDNGNGPDIYRFHNSWPLQLQGYLAPLPSDVVESLELNTQYYNVIKADISKNGAYYGVPLQVDTLALFMNDDLFKAADIANPPTTWIELTDMAGKLTVQDELGSIKTAGVALGTYDNIYHASDIISLLLVQNRADLYNLSGPTKQNAVEALGPKFYSAFAIDNDSGGNKTWDSSFENSKVAFANGTLAMYFGYSWDIFEIKQRNPDLNFTVVPVPNLTPERSETIASYWVEGVSTKSKHQKEAFIFLNYLGKKETLEKLYKLESQQRLFGELYPRRDMKTLLVSNPLLKTFLDQADNAVSTPFSSDTYDGAMNAALNTYMGNAVNSILEGGSAESAIDTLGAGEAQVLKNYGVGIQQPK